MLNLSQIFGLNSPSLLTEFMKQKGIFQQDIVKAFLQTERPTFKTFAILK